MNNLKYTNYNKVLPSNHMGNMEITSKFMDLQSTLSFHQTKTINTHNAPFIIDLFNKCFVHWSGIQPWSFPWPGIEGVLSHSENEEIHSKKIIDEVHDLHELHIGLSTVGIGSRYLQFYSSETSTVEDLIEIVGFRNSEYRFDPNALDHFLQKANGLLCLDGEYVLDDVKKSLSCDHKHSSLNAICHVDVTDRNSRKIEFIFEKNQISIKHWSNESRTIENRELDDYIRRELSGVIAISTTSNLKIASVTNGINAIIRYDSKDGMIVMNPSSITMEDLPDFDMKKYLARANLIAACLNLTIDPN